MKRTRRPLWKESFCWVRWTSLTTRRRYGPPFKYPRPWRRTRKGRRKRAILKREVAAFEDSITPAEREAMDRNNSALADLLGKIGVHLP